jgi:hypothetical protein
MPCPVIGENVDKNDSNKRIIQASKTLRQHFLGYKEEKACAICPLADKCSLKNMPVADSYLSTKPILEKQNTGDASLYDVTLLLAGLYFRDAALSGEKQLAVFNSATTILRSLEDIFVDLQENNGIEWKLFLSEVNA